MSWYRCSNQILCKWEGCFVDVGCEPVGDGGVQAYPCCPKCGRTAVVIGGPTVSNHTTLTEPAKQMLEASKEQADPTGKAAKEPGSKLDLGKSPVVRGALQYFPRALSSIAEVSQKGAEKYTWKGWESVPDGFVRYSDALGRHLLSESIEDTDEETGCLHAAQVAWNALARLELLLKDREG